MGFRSYVFSECSGDVVRGVSESEAGAAHLFEAPADGFSAPSKCETSSTKPHPPKADAWPLVSLSAYQCVPSPKLLAWAGPYASGRMPTWPTSTQPEPATHRTEAINGIIERGQTHRQRLPQPHQLPAPNAPHRRRPRCFHPHTTLKSRFNG